MMTSQRVLLLAVPPGQVDTCIPAQTHHTYFNGTHDTWVVFSSHVLPIHTRGEAFLNELCKELLDTLQY